MNDEQPKAPVIKCPWCGCTMTGTARCFAFGLAGRILGSTLVFLSLLAVVGLAIEFWYEINGWNKNEFFRPWRIPELLIATCISIITTFMAGVMLRKSGEHRVCLNCKCSSPMLEADRAPRTPQEAYYRQRGID
jgi:hypothetical protein